MSNAAQKNRIRQGEILAAMIEYQDIAEKGSQILQDRHFTDPRLLALFHAIKAVLGASECVSAASVKEYAGENVGYSLIMDLLGMGIGPKHWEFLLAKHLEDQMRYDAVKAIAEASQRLAIDGDGADTDNEIHRLQQQLADIKSISTKNALAETPHQIIQHDIAYLKKHGYPKAFNLNYERMQQITGGFSAGDMVVLAARPSVGKSTMSLNWAYCFEQSKLSLLFVSLEMSQGDLSRSMIRIASKKPLDKRASIEELEAGDKFIKDMNIRITQASGSNMQSIAARIRQLHREHPVDIVFIDHLAKIKGNGGRGRYDDVTEISNELADLAHNTGIVVVVLAQLNRELEKRPDPRPKMSDLRDSGAIEQDADMIIFLHNETKEKSSMQIVLADVAKNRTGSTGQSKFVFHKETSTFLEITE